MSKDLVTIDNPHSAMGQFLVYEAEDGQVKIDVRLEDETVWLTQQLMAELFQSSKQNINHHIQSIYEEGELVPEATVKKYLTVRREGKREVKRLLDYYNLDVIISVGYRAKSHVATRFRIWATQRLREYGQRILPTLSAKLTAEFGSGWNERNLAFFMPDEKGES